MVLRQTQLWHVCVLGPVPLGQIDRIGITINCILQPSEECALGAVHERLQELCDAWKHDYDPSEWDLIHVIPINCN